MGKISLLDCTLRDGGYINDWRFGEEAIYDISDKIIQAGIEALEIGFLKPVQPDKDRTMFGRAEDIARFICPKKQNTLYIAMLDLSMPFLVEQIPQKSENTVDAFRIIFKKHKISEAFDYIKAVQQKGYKVFIQPVGTSSYSDEEFVSLIQKCNTLNPEAVYIVDSFGMIKKKQFLNYLKLADANLAENIALGYHSHNNLQQASSNAEAMVEQELKRDIFIDACVFGMGRGAGNLNMELFAQYLNENYNKNYRIEPILEIIDEYLNDIYSQNFWGYSLPFYLSASNGCHPNYASAFASKGTLTVKSFRELLRTISQEDKEIFSKDKAEEYYKAYQQQYVDDRETIKKLKSALGGKTVLILAPGYNLTAQKNRVDEILEKETPVIICVNFYSTEYKCDFLFSSNYRRYHKLESVEGICKIITSNIKEETKYDYMVNFASYCCSQNEIIDNSGLMCIHLMMELGVKDVKLAGFDGYNMNNQKHYVNSGLEYSWSKEEMTNRNKWIYEEIQRQRQHMNIEFVTDSCYEG